MIIFNQIIDLPNHIANDTSYVVSFFDDFNGVNFDNRTWSVSGSGSVTKLNQLNGVVRVRASGGSYEFFQQNSGHIPASNGCGVIWRGQMIPSAGGGECEYGVEGSGTQGTDWACWHSSTSNANFFCQVSDSTLGLTQVDSGIPRNTNFNLFELKCTSNGVQFLFNGVLVATINRNFSPTILQPFIFLVSGGTSSDCNTDFVLMSGGRI
jgi:hypothetical protein